MSQAALAPAPWLPADGTGSSYARSVRSTPDLHTAPELGDDVRAYLKTPNEFGEVLGNSPAAIYALAMWQRGYTRMSPEKAASEVARLRATKEYQAGDKRYTDAVALVSKIAARGQSRELEVPRPAPARILAPAEVERGKIEKAIAEIRKNPDYPSIDSKKRKPLVEKMSALQAQLHQG